MVAITPKTIAPAYLVAIAVPHCNGCSRALAVEIHDLWAEFVEFQTRLVKS
jgi:hypothetical protein